MKKKRVRWSVNDVTQGLMLRTISRRAYQYIRKSNLIPVPAISTLRKWIQHINFEPGIQMPILRVIQEQMRSVEKRGFSAASLAFDEMDIMKQFQYDPKEDQVMRPHKKVQVAVLRGLISNWKQQIYYDFDKPMSRELLFSIIVAAEDHGIEICSIVGDLGNQGLFKSLGVSHEKPFFENPACQNRRVYVFPDAPHLLKLLRNHLLDKGYLLQDGTEIDKDDLKKIVEKDSGELKILHKLLPIHFNCVNSTRQRVRLAAQLISHTTATAIRCLLPDKKKLADWVDLFDEWFDVLNSRVLYHSKKMACGFGVHFEDQNSVLERAFSMTESMRERGRKGLLPFQRGILLSIRALQALHQDLKKKYGVEFLMTSRLNQDSVENTFSQIRGIGSSHLGPLDCKHRIRLILLGKNGTALVENPAVRLEEEILPDESSTFDTTELLLKEITSKILPEPL